jgi:hypothetical protein
LPEALQVLLAVVSQQIMLSACEERFFLTQSAKELLQGVELSGLGQVRKITRMKNVVRLLIQRVDLIYRRLKCSIDIRIGRSVKTDVTIADVP